jgi:acyl carrier protein
MTDRGAPHAVHEVEGRILEFIRAELVSPGAAVGRDDDLLSDDLLDSIAVLRLATFVDEQYRLRMQPADFLVENFQTVAALARFVLGRTTGSGSPS